MKPISILPLFMHSTWVKFGIHVNLRVTSCLSCFRSGILWLVVTGVVQHVKSPWLAILIPFAVCRFFSFHFDNIIIVITKNFYTG